MGVWVNKERWSESLETVKNSLYKKLLQVIFCWKAMQKIFFYNYKMSYKKLHVARTFKRKKEKPT